MMPMVIHICYQIKFVNPHRDLLLHLKGNADFVNPAICEMKNPSAHQTPMHALTNDARMPALYPAFRVQHADQVVARPTLEETKM